MTPPKHVPESAILAVNECREVAGFTAYDLLRVARQKLLDTEPFFAGALFQASYLIVKQGAIAFDLMRIGRNRVLFAEPFVHRCTRHGLRGIHVRPLVTSIMRIMLKLMLRHNAREAGKNVQVWRLASAVVVDGMIHAFNELEREKCGKSFTNFTPLYEGPSGLPLMVMPDYNGRSAEEVYDKLLRLVDTSTGSGGIKTMFKLTDEQMQALDDLMPPSMADLEVDDETNLADEARWKRVLIDSVRRAQAHGRCPSDVLKVANMDGKPKLDFKDVLPQVFEGACRGLERETWAQPNRRQAAMEGALDMDGMNLEADHLPRLPGYEGQSTGCIVVAVDTSGSIYGVPQLLGSFLTEISGLHARFKPSVMYVLDCDAVVHDNVRVFRANDVVPDSMGFTGGGGTDFRPVWDWLEEQEIKPTCLIYFTDMFGTFPENTPHNTRFPTVWVNYGGAEVEPPFGKTTYAQLDL